MPTPDFVVSQSHSTSEVQEFKPPVDDGEISSTTEEAAVGSPDVAEVTKPTGIGKLKKSFKRIFQRKPKDKKDMIQSINIVQQDETDYDKQWSRKVNRAASFGNQQLLSNDDEEQPASNSRASSSTSAGTTATNEDDGIPVIFDAEDDIQL